MSKIRQLNKSDLRPLVTHTLLFLFPIAGNTVKSWTGLIFGLLFITAALSIRDIMRGLSRGERALLVLATAIFFVIVVANLLNDWTYTQTRGLGVYVRWLLFIPIYLLIRAHRGSFLWLACGSALAALLLCTQSIVDVYMLDTGRSYGAYDSPGLVGIQSLIFAITLIAAIIIFQNNKKIVVLCGLGCLAAVISVVLSGSRSTYFLIALLVPCLVIIFFRFKRALLILSFITACTTLFYFSNDFFSDRIRSGVKETQDYFNNPDPAQVAHGSVGTRLEMWKVSLLIAGEHPIIGVGWRNFQENTKPFVNQGLVSISASQHPHPHNMYLEFLSTSGLCGLLLVTALFALIVRVALASTAINPIHGRLLLIFSLAFIFNGINEGGAFAYGNALSFFLVYLAVFFSMAQHKSQRVNPRIVNH